MSDEEQIKLLEENRRLKEEIIHLKYTIQINIIELNAKLPYADILDRATIPIRINSLQKVVDHAEKILHNNLIIK